MLRAMFPLGRSGVVCCKPRGGALRRCLVGGELLLVSTLFLSSRNGLELIVVKSVYLSVIEKCRSLMI